MTKRKTRRTVRKKKPVLYIKTEDGTYVPEKFYRVNKPPRSVPRYRKEGKRFIRTTSRGKLTTRRKKRR